VSRWRRTEQNSHEFAELVAQARDNESMLRRFQGFELKLMGALDISESVRLLLSGSQSRFGQDATSLFLVDSENAIQRGLNSNSSVSTPGLNLFQDESTLRRLLDIGHTPRLGAFDPRRHSRLFTSETGVDPGSLASICIVPFMRGSSLSGCLNLASRDPDRYRAGVGTDFLTHFGAVAAISIEAVVTRHQLRTLGLTDALTGVSNRRFFDQRLIEESARARRESIPLSLVFIDVDHFKKVNDVGGHAFGDQILCDVAAAILSEVRMFDVVSRFGGDEFAVLLIGATREKAREISERIRQAVERTGLSHASDEIPAVTASIGVATVDRSRTHDPSSLLESADRAVYLAKAAGRNQLVFDRDEPDTDNQPPRPVQ